jgi:hypothetical protein
MRNVQQLLADARLLPPEERRRLIDALEEFAPAGGEDIPAEPYAHTLATAFIVDSSFSDVSANKYEHLAAAYTSTDDDRR